MVKPKVITFIYLSNGCKNWKVEMSLTSFLWRDAPNHFSTILYCSLTMERTLMIGIILKKIIVASANRSECYYYLFMYFTANSKQYTWRPVNPWQMTFVSLFIFKLGRLSLYKFRTSWARSTRINMHKM